MKSFLVALLVIWAGAAHATEKADLVIVRKSRAMLYLMHQGMVLKEFHVALSPNHQGPKVMEGDERTPEGRYVLDYKNSDSSFYKSIHISYPNQADLARAHKYNVDPGGEIMIHGLPPDTHLPPSIVQEFNWTDGCIAVTNHQMDEIWAAVDVGTPIEILP